MLTTDTNRVTMIRTTCVFCDNNASATAGITNYAGVVTSAKNKLVLIDALNILGGGSSTGVTLDTVAIRNSLMTFTVKLGAGLKALAGATNSNVLYVAADHSFPQLSKMAKDDVDDTCDSIIALATTNAVALVGYGVAALDITDAGTALALYRVSMEDPRQKIIEHKTANAGIPPIINDIITNLFERQLDNMTDTLRVSNDVYYRGYYSARENLNAGTHHTGGAHPSFYVTVKDNATGFLCQGAIVTFGLQASVVTSKNGKAHIKANDAAEQRITVKMGGKTVTVTVYDPTSGNITVDMAFGAYTASHYDSLIPGFDVPLLFAGVGAHNCVLRSDGIFTVDNGSGSIHYISQIDHAEYVLTINYATGEITTPGGAPPDGTLIAKPTT